ncbi:hypothetical protein Lser_V15G09888 [Lactuca serriola]
MNNSLVVGYAGNAFAGSDKVNVQLIDVINKEIKIRSPVLSQQVYSGEEGHLA